MKSTIELSPIPSLDSLLSTKTQENGLVITTNDNDQYRFIVTDELPSEEGVIKLLGDYIKISHHLFPQQGVAEIRLELDNRHNIRKATIEFKS